MNPDALITQVQLNIGVTADGIAGPRTWNAIYEKIFGQPATTTDLDAIIKAIQKMAGVTPDGDPGPLTWTAISNSITSVAEEPPAEPNTGNAGDKVDSRSEGVISSLLPEVQPLARQLVHKAAAAGITIKIISGLRTFSQQDALYAQGRTAPGPKVTNAKGGYSNHNFGLAFDIGVFENGKYMGESPSYNKLGPIGVSIGLAWGGNWVSIKDTPHYELRPAWAKDMPESDMLAGLRDRKARSVSLLV